ncbi:MAG: Flp pilus assembly protein CpaB [Polyangiaceae bacterium]|nr:Flp pilus assembly protein CpaB [Polyangiaceae bacterium]
MISSKTLVFVSLASGALAAGLGHVYLTRLEQDVAGGPKVRVLSTARDLAIGAAITRDNLAVQEVPASYVNRRQVRAQDAEKLVGVRTTAMLKAGDTLEWSDVAGGEVAARSLAGLVQKGMRALNISSDQLFDGLLRPGDRVDLLFTSHAGSETVTLLQNLLVLAVNGSTEASAEGTSSHGSANSVVLSLSVEQAQTITQAEQGGTLRLSLRNADDITLLEKLPGTTREDIHRTETPADVSITARKQPQVPVIERVQ